jgi:hypothetical protein
MNIIRDQREHIITNNNIGNTELANILENTNKQIESLVIKESLHGDLDFSIIKTMGFGLLTEITIQEGDVISISNLPEGLKKFTCSKNLLIELENLPKSIEELDVNNNYIEGFNIDYLKNLKVLNCSYNKIKELKLLPASIQEIYCENNNLLVSIHLGNVDQLNVLNISNTNVHIIYDYPEGVVDFKMENTPSIEFRNATGNISLNDANKENIEEEIKKKQNYIEALDDYFLLKTNYEKRLLEAKRKLFKNAVTKKMAKKSASNAKIPCIKCKRPVGTKFINNNNKYMAICGDTQNPCTLDIQIYTGELDMYKEQLYYIYQNIQEYKQNIICKKLDALFSFVSEDESIQSFKEELDNYNSETKIYTPLLNMHNDIYNNIDKSTLIDKKNEVIFRLKESIHKLLIDYKETNNKDFLRQAVLAQHKQLTPEFRNLRMLKYEVMEMDKQYKQNQNENTRILLNEICELEIAKEGNTVTEYHLVQRPVALTKMEYSFHEDPRVIKFVK